MRAGSGPSPRRRSALLDHVTGEVLRVTEDGCVLGVGGVGLRVEMPTGDAADLSGRATVHTVLQIREEQVHLYGFSSDRGRELFRALTTVSGVGPKVALAVLSFHAPTSLERTIAAGDADALTLVSGVGKKTAQRIVLELRDKLGVAEVAEPTGALGEVREALRGLGYSTGEVQDVVAGLPADGDAQTLLRLALRALGAETAGVDR